MEEIVINVGSQDTSQEIAVVVVEVVGTDPKDVVISAMAEERVRVLSTFLSFYVQNFCMNIL